MRVLWAAALIVVLDQATKVAVKRTMYEGESIPVVGRLFRLTFTENPGMAFGLSLGSKLFLTLFSVAATVAILLYLWHVRRGPAGYRVALMLIFAGALGNVIDRVFYGALWGECLPSPPGSSRLFYGCVVDFIHLDVWSGYVGPKYVALFPIGNIADLAIIAGVVLVLVSQGAYQRWLHAAHPTPVEPLAEQLADAPPLDAADRTQTPV